MNVAIGGLLLKVGLPLVLTAGGVVAFVTAPSEASPEAAVWIDSPVTGVRVDPGAVNVVAHATAASGVSSMTLEVDGEQVVTTDELDRFDTLVTAQFAWDASVGEHALVAIGGGHRSAAVFVVVGEAGEVTTLPASTTTTIASSSTTSISSTSSTTSTSTTVPVTVAPTAAPTAPPTAPPTAKPTVPPTSPPVTAPPAPTVGNVAASPTLITGTALCQASTVVTVTASVTNATAATVRMTLVPSGGIVYDLTVSISGGQLTARLPASGQGPVTGNYSVSLKVTGPGGTATASGPIIDSRCTKD